MPQGLLRTVQSDAIIIAQAIILQHAFNFQQFSVDGVAVHAGMVTDSV